MVFAVDEEICLYKFGRCCLLKSVLNGAVKLDADMLVTSPTYTLNLKRLAVFESIVVQ